MTIKICSHPDGCQNEPRKCLAVGCQQLPKREELTPEEKDAERYLLKRYGPELEAVPMHWVKSVAEYAAEKDALLKEVIVALKEARQIVHRCDRNLHSDGTDSGDRILSDLANYVDNNPLGIMIEKLITATEAGQNETTQK